MKNKIYLLILIFYALGSCKNKETPQIMNPSQDVVEIKKEYVFEDIDVYQPDSSLYPILDTIVKAASLCQELTSKETFYFISFFKEADSLTRVRVIAIDQKKLYCKNTNRVFEYKNKLFGINADEIYNKLFSYTGRKIKVKCMRENSSMFDHDDSYFARWVFIYGKNIKCIEYMSCNKQWRDEKYFDTDND